jgi:hypothetical protein
LFVTGPRFVRTLGRGACGCGDTTATGNATGSASCGTCGRYRPGTVSACCTAGAGCALTSLAGRIATATVTASPAKLITTNASALPISTVLGGGGAIISV